MGGVFRRRYELEDGEVVVATYGHTPRAARRWLIPWTLLLAMTIYLAINSGLWHGWWSPSVASHLLLVLITVQLAWSSAIPPKWLITNRQVIEPNYDPLHGLLRLDGPCYIAFELLGPPRLERRRRFFHRSGYETVVCDIEGSPKILKIRNIRDFETAIQLINEGRERAQNAMAENASRRAPNPLPDGTFA